MNRIIFPILLVALLATPAAAELTFEIRNDMSGSFINIASTGNILNLSDDGEQNIFSTVLGRTVRIGNNGGLALSSNGNLGWQNSSLPSNQAFNNRESFLPYWDDLDSESGSVRWQDNGDRLIVQWTERNHYNGAFVNEGITFQAQIFKSSVDAVFGDTIAQFVYADTQFANSQSQWNDGISATIGWQDGNGMAVEYSYNTASVTAGTVLTMVAVPEPGAMFTFTAGIVCLFSRRRRRSVAV